MSARVGLVVVVLIAGCSTSKQNHTGETKPADCDAGSALAQAFEAGAEDPAAAEVMAECAVRRGDFDAAAASVDHAGDTANARRLRLEIHAHQQDAQRVQQDLHALGKSDGCSDLVLKTKQLVPLLHDRGVFATAAWCWFVDSAAGKSSMPSQAYFQLLGEASARPVIHPRVAAADPAATDRLVNVIGIITGAELDRSGNSMILRLVHVEVNAHKVGSRTATTGRHEEFTLSGAYMVNDTREVGSFREEYTPSGLTVFVRLPLNEGLLVGRELQIVATTVAPFSTSQVKAVGSVAMPDDAGAVYLNGIYAAPRAPRSWEQ